MNRSDKGQFARTDQSGPAQPMRPMGRADLQLVARPIPAHPGFSGPSGQAKFLGRAGLGRFLFMGQAGPKLGQAAPPDWTFVPVWVRHHKRVPAR